MSEQNGTPPIPTVGRIYDGRVGVIYVCQPDYGLGHRMSHQQFWTGTIKPGSPLVGHMRLEQFPISFNAGNVFIAGALNAQEAGYDITHLAILHNDIVPETGWVETLLDEMLAHDADLMSAVVPIKDLNGLSSVAIDSLDDPFEVERRISMTEIYKLPETFTAADCGYPHRKLLVNHGCILIDFTKEWRKAENPDGTLKITMTSPDRIGRRPDGRWEAQHSPSDWRFSRDVQNLGGKVMATRKIKLYHMGEMPYTSMMAWGDWETDQALWHKWAHMPIDGQRDFSMPLEYDSNEYVEEAYTK